MLVKFELDGNNVIDSIIQGHFTSRLMIVPFDSRNESEVLFIRVGFAESQVGLTSDKIFNTWRIDYGGVEAAICESARFWFHAILRKNLRSRHVLGDTPAVLCSVAHLDTSRDDLRLHG